MSESCPLWWDRVTAGLRWPSFWQSRAYGDLCQRMGIAVRWLYDSEPGNAGLATSAADGVWVVWEGPTREGVATAEEEFDGLADQLGAPLLAVLPPPRPLRSGDEREPALSRGTVLVDLRASEAALFGRLARDRRNLVRQARRYGCVVRTPRNTAEVERFIEIYAGRMVETGDPGAGSPEYVRALLALPGVTLLLSTLDDQERITGGWVLVESRSTHQSRMQSRYAAVAGEYLHTRANFLLAWESLRFARARGCAVFDLDGYTVNAKRGTKLAGINRFNEGFGGVVSVYRSYMRGLPSAAWPFDETEIEPWRETTVGSAMTIGRGTR